MKNCHSEKLLIKLNFVLRLNCNFLFRLGLALLNLGPRAGVPSANPALGSTQYPLVLSQSRLCISIQYTEYQGSTQSLRSGGEIEPLQVSNVLIFLNDIFRYACGGGFSSSLALFFFFFFFFSIWKRGLNSKTVPRVRPPFKVILRFFQNFSFSKFLFQFSGSGTRSVLKRGR